jgi:multidrug efflux pump subunit AcrB
LFYINYQLPEGTDIRTTAKDMPEIDKRIRAKAGIISVACFVGRGAGRYILTYNPEQPNTSKQRRIGIRKKFLFNRCKTSKANNSNNDKANNC